MSWEGGIGGCWESEGAQRVGMQPRAVEELGLSQGSLKTH